MAYLQVKDRNLHQPTAAHVDPPHHRAALDLPASGLSIVGLSIAGLRGRLSLDAGGDVPDAVGHAREDEVARDIAPRRAQSRHIERIVAFELDAAASACRELRPAIMVMKSTKNRPNNELPEPLGRPMTRRIFVRGKMCSTFVVVAGVGRKNLAQMGLAQYNDVIAAFTVDRAENSLGMPVLPG